MRQRILNQGVLTLFTSVEQQIVSLMRLAQNARKGTPKKERWQRTLDQKVTLVSAGRSSRKAFRGFVTPVKIDANRERVYLHSAERKRFDDRKRVETKREKKNAQARARRAAKRQVSEVAA